jgi:hypothetical protein
VVDKWWTKHSAKDAWPQPLIDQNEFYKIIHQKKLDQMAFCKNLTKLSTTYPPLIHHAKIMKKLDLIEQTIGRPTSYPPLPIIIIFKKICLLKISYNKLKLYFERIF